MSRRSEQVRRMNHLLNVALSIDPFGFGLFCCGHLDVVSYFFALLIRTCGRINLVHASYLTAQCRKVDPVENFYSKLIPPSLYCRT